jgi:tyrosinase
MFRFWDWTLDWEDPPSSPIFDYFGHDGDPEAPKYGASHCVTDLPFKNLKPHWHGDEYDPHCLTRLFEEDWFGHYMNPEAMEDIMKSETYADFFLAVEMGPHDIIPMGIRGDFTSFTAPNGTTNCF